MGFENCHFVLLEDGTLVWKHVGDDPFLFVLIKTMHLVGTMNGVLWYKETRGRANFILLSDMHEILRILYVEGDSKVKYFTVCDQ